MIIKETAPAGGNQFRAQIDKNSKQHFTSKKCALCGDLLRTSELSLCCQCVKHTQYRREVEQFARACQ